jgi:AcrR family transcriptional regulator
MVHRVISADVLDAARRLAVRGALRTATMQELADEAGVSRVTLYRRGATRENVLAALREELARDEREAVWPALVADGNARERLERALFALCAANERSLDLIDSLADDARDAIYHAGGDRALTREEFTAPLRRLLVDGAADGSLRRHDDVDEVATILYNQIGWTYGHLRRGHGWTPERAARGVVTLAVSGVA